SLARGLRPARSAVRLAVRAQPLPDDRPLWPVPAPQPGARAPEQASGDRRGRGRQPLVAAQAAQAAVAFPARSPPPVALRKQPPAVPGIYNPLAAPSLRAMTGRRAVAGSIGERADEVRRLVRAPDLRRVDDPGRTQPFRPALPAADRQ